MFSLIIQAILSFINQIGYLGIFIGMTIESSFVPFPSEVILIPAGALIAQGKMNFLPVFLASLLGSIAGALINFFLAFYLGRKTTNLLLYKYGKLLFLTKNKLKKSDNYFEKHGEITTFVGRLIPVVRQLISLPAGFSKMNLSKFILFTSLGSGIWTIFLIYIGYFFGSNISPNLKLITTLTALIIAVISLAIYIIRKKNSSH